MPYFNEMLWFLFLFFDMSMVILVYYFWGKTGLFGFIVLSLAVANIQVVKLVELFGLTTTLGNILYASVFLATDILSEFYSKEEAKKAVLLGFIALLLMTIYMSIALLFIPAPTDTSQPSLEVIFGFLPRIVLASLCAYITSQTLDVYLYHWIYQRTHTKYIWVRNLLSTLVSQSLDTAIFTTIAFLGVFSMDVLIQLFITTYVLKAIVAFADTPFIYLARTVYRKRYEGKKELLEL